jgi:glycosyltransferase involved in cell wall biosynthesis
MRVALVVHCFFPDHYFGTESYTFDLARNLRRLGHDVVVLSAVFAGEPRRSRPVTRYEYDGVPVYAIDKNYYPNTRVRDTYYQPEIRQIHEDLLNEVKPDIVHVTHLINHTGVVLEAVHSLGIPVVATFTDFYGFCFTNRLEAADGSLCEGPNAQRTNCLACYLKAASKHPPASPLLRIAGKPAVSTLAAIAMERAARIPGLRQGGLAELVLDITRRPDTLAACYAGYKAAIAPTRLLKSAYIRNGFTAPLHEIRFGVDLSRSRKPAAARDAPVRFGFIGQIAAHKGVDILVEAFCRLPAGSAELRIHGSVDQSPEYVNALRQLARDRAVFFDGTFPSDQMANVLAGIDFLVVPSTWHENSPLVLLSALASHTPVIVSNVAGLTEFVEAGVNGWIFERGDVNDLARVTQEIVRTAESSRALTHTTEYPRTTAMMTEDVLDLYETIR